MKSAGQGKGDVVETDDSNLQKKNILFLQCLTQ